MSKFVSIKTELRDLTLIKRALDDLELDWQENVTWKHRYSTTSRTGVIVVNAPGAYLGIAPTASPAAMSAQDAPAEMIFDDMQKDAITTLVGRIQQRYAYHKVVQEAQTAGFDLVEEQTGKDQVIRLTVRRWSN